MQQASILQLPAYNQNLGSYRSERSPAISDIQNLSVNSQQGPTASTPTHILSPRPAKTMQPLLDHVILLLPHRDILDPPEWLTKLCKRYTATFST